MTELLSSLDCSQHAPECGSESAWIGLGEALRQVAKKKLEQLGFTRQKAAKQVDENRPGHEAFAKIVEGLRWRKLYREENVPKKQRKTRTSLSRRDFSLGEAHFFLIARLQEGTIPARALSTTHPYAGTGIISSERICLPKEIWRDFERVGLRIRRQFNSCSIPGPLPGYEDNVLGTYKDVKSGCFRDICNLQIEEKSLHRALEQIPAFELPVELLVHFSGADSERRLEISFGGKVYTLKLTKGLAAIIILVEHAQEDAIQWVQLDKAAGILSKAGTTASALSKSYLADEAAETIDEIDLGDDGNNAIDGDVDPDPAAAEDFDCLEEDGYDDAVDDSSGLSIGYGDTRLDRSNDAAAKWLAANGRGRQRSGMAIGASHALQDTDGDPTPSATTPQTYYFRDKARQAVYHAVQDELEKLSMSCLPLYAHLGTLVPCDREAFYISTDGSGMRYWPRRGPAKWRVTYD